MYYFKRNGNLVEKYLVEFDKEKLDELKTSINNNLSNHEYNNDKSLNIQYEVVTPDPLVNMINSLLSENNVDILNELTKDNIFDEKESIDEFITRRDNIKNQINKKYEFLNSVQEIGLKKLVLDDIAELGNELREMLKERPYYYLKLQELINFSLIDEMELDSIVDVLTFMNDDKHKYIFKMIDENNKTR